MIQQFIKDTKDKSHYFLKNLFIPPKGSDTLSLQQKTITISLWIILLFCVLSILIEAINLKNHWLSFVENLMIGIACSAIVVVVTVFLQFKAEQENRIREHNSALYQLLSCIKACLLESNIPISKEQYLLDSLYNRRDNYIDHGLGLRWYSNRKVREYFDVIKNALPLIIPLLEKYPIASLSDYQEKISPQMYNDAVKAAIIFSADYNPKDTKNRFEELFLHLE